jgi:hypothetical protein
MSLLTLLSRRRVRYLLRDTFATALAAGSVNGTSAEPGPGTRGVTDASSNLSIAGGQAVFSGVNAASMTYQTGVDLSRRAGAVLLGVLRHSRATAGGATWVWGWSSSATPGTGMQIGATVYPANSVGPDAGVRAIESGAVTGYYLWFAAQGTDYPYALLRRRAGAHHFVKVGGSWYHVYVANSYTVTPGVTVYHGVVSTTVTAVDNPWSARFGGWLPSPLASDSFDRTASALGIADGGGHLEAQQTETLGLGGAGLAWTEAVGTWQTASGKASASALSGGLAVAFLDVADATAQLEVEVTRAAGVAGVVFRWVDANNHFRAYHDGTNVKLDKVVAGVVTNVSSNVATYAAGGRFLVTPGQFGTTQRIQVVYVATPSAGASGSFVYDVVNDAALQSGTKVGLYSTDTGNTFDNLRVWAHGGYGSGTGPTLTPVPALTVSSPAPYQVVQRTVPVVGTGPIPIAGTYSGGGTVSIEARFNGGSWATIATGVTGAFGGTLTGQAQGSGSLDVRVVSTTTATSVHHVGVGDVFVVAGQSNATGHGTNNQVWSHASLTAGMFGNDYAWHRLVDPLDRASAQYGETQIDSVSDDTVQAGSGGTPAGSYWPLLAQQILDGKGIPVAFVPCPLGGTAIAQWQPGGNHQDRTTLYGSMAYRALTAGGAGGVRAVLWHQGEADATTGSGTSQAQYTARLQALGDAVLSDLAVPLVAAKIHAFASPANDITIVNSSVVAVAGTHNVLLGPDFHLPSDITTTLHFTTDAELLAAATRWYAALGAAGIY